MERIGRLLPTGPEDKLVHRCGRRRSSRFPIDAEVSVIEPVEAEGMVLNASTGGMRITADRCLVQGQRVVLLVRFRSGKRSLEEGLVVWLHEHRDGCVAGTRFVETE